MQNLITNWEVIASVVTVVATIYYIYRLLDKHLLGEIFEMMRKNKL